MNINNKSTQKSAETRSKELDISNRAAQEEKARRLHHELCSLARTSLRLAFKLGGILSDLKKEVKHGGWESYTAEQLKIPPRTASNYMRIFRDLRNFNNLGPFLTSESVSDFGIREVLDRLADHDKAKKKTEGLPKTPESENPTHKKGSKKRNKTSEFPAFELADGSRFDLRRHKWSDGLITWQDIQTWINKSRPAADDTNSIKQAARHQRAAIHLALAINQSFGKAKTDDALELMDSAIDSVRLLMQKDTSQQTVKVMVPKPQKEPPVTRVRVTQSHPCRKAIWVAKPSGS